MQHFLKHGADMQNFIKLYFLRTYYLYTYTYLQNNLDYLFITHVLTKKIKYYLTGFELGQCG